eukprot:1136305-Pelagomonas_calceolata.AAC.2
MEEKRRAPCGRREDVEKRSCAQKLRHTSDRESRTGDLRKKRLRKPGPAAFIKESSPNKQAS